MAYVLRAIDGSGFLGAVLATAGTDVVVPTATQDLASALRFDSEAEASWQAGVPGMADVGWEVTVVNEVAEAAPAEGVPAEAAPEADVAVPVESDAVPALVFAVPEPAPLAAAPPVPDCPAPA